MCVRACVCACVCVCVCGVCVRARALHSSFFVASWPRVCALSTHARTRTHARAQVLDYIANLDFWVAEKNLKQHGKYLLKKSEARAPPSARLSAVYLWPAQRLRLRPPSGAIRASRAAACCAQAVHSRGGAYLLPHTRGRFIAAHARPVYSRTRAACL